ncbi:MAG: hypothetical protein AVO39_05645 [delta proteobacterium MLS_D]|nr:MAG: hypothetical protein AVO39_05645 [delta proteobacterium MLS_D]
MFHTSFFLLLEGDGQGGDERAGVNGGAKPAEKHSARCSHPLPVIPSLQGRGKMIWEHPPARVGGKIKT